MINFLFTVKDDVMGIAVVDDGVTHSLQPLLSKRGFCEKKFTTVRNDEITQLFQPPRALFSFFFLNFAIRQPNNKKSLSNTPKTYIDTSVWVCFSSACQPFCRPFRQKELMLLRHTLKYTLKQNTCPTWTWRAVATPPSLLAANHWWLAATPQVSYPRLQRNITIMGSGISWQPCTPTMRDSPFPCAMARCSLPVVMSNIWV